MLPGLCESLLSSSATSLGGAVLVRLPAGRQLHSASSSAGIFRVALVGNTRSRQTWWARGQLIYRYEKEAGHSYGKHC